MGNALKLAAVNLLDDHEGYLLDTHTFLWAVKCPKRLSKDARTIIENPDVSLYLSSISAFEIMNKWHIGKLDATYENVVKSYVRFAQCLGVKDLPIALDHAYLAGNMEWDHRDPFDRLLVAQASLENLTIITNDAQMQAHPWVDTVW